MLLGYGEILYDLNQAVLRAAAQKDDSSTNFIAVGRNWIPTASQYQGLIASYNKVTGGIEKNFNLAGAIPGRLQIDFAGSGGDNLCNAVAYVNNGFIAACRSMVSTGYYDIYLAKFDNNGTMDAAFGTAGIKKTSLGGNSTNGHAFVRGIIYDSSTGNPGNNGTVVITGAIGFYSPGVFHPFVAAFDQQTGAQYGSTTTLSSINGTAVAITFDNANSKYYTASTDTSANHKFYVNQFDTSLVAAGSPWGSAVDFTTAISDAAADSVPSGIAMNGSLVITVGSNRVNTSSAWRCALTAHNTGTGNLSTAYGRIVSPLTGGTSNKGITLFTPDATRDCILNAGSSYPSPSDTVTNLVGTAYNGTNYDYLSARVLNDGSMDTSFATTGMQMQSNGSADDVLNFCFNLSASTSYLYAVGRSQNSSLINGMVASKISTAGTFDTVTNNSWTATTTLGAPKASLGGINYVGQWTGSSFIAWGGGTPSNGGGIYNPVADSWSSMTTNGAPAAGGVFAVWTGTKLLMWGGSVSATFNTGALYDPTNDSWTAMATAGAPVGRRNTNYPSSVAVWTGTYAIIWGGETGSQLNSGGLYNPATNAWTTIPTLGAPSTRQTYETTWTGSKFMVFGGIGGSLVNTGGFYDPTNNNWSSIATLNAPSPRYSGASAWGSPRFYVFGGFTGSYVNTGAYYDTSTNAWTTMTTNGAPSQRTKVKGFWTGSRFIVWGGTNGTAMNTGGIYDYASNSWTSMATTNAPPIRDSFPFAWIGNKVLVFGGSATNINTGGLYTP